MAMQSEISRIREQTDSFETTTQKAADLKAHCAF